MNDTDYVEAAYADAVKRLFVVYFEALSTGGGLASTETEAASNFKNGLALARRVRAQAVSFVTEGTSR